MTTIIGRVGLDDALAEPVSGSWSGGELSLSLLLGQPNGTADSLVTIREQILGLANNPDEPVVPVLVDSDPSAAGFYAVKDVRVDQPTDSLRTNGALTASVTLERITSSAAPLVESRLVFGKRDAGSAVSHWLDLPPGSFGAVFTDPGAAAFSNNGREGIETRLGDQPASGFASWGAAPEDWYLGAARITADGSLVVGRQMQPGAAVELSNGWMRLSIDGTSPKFTVQMWEDGWRTPHTYWLVDVPTPCTALVTVDRNAPEEVAVQVVYPYGPGIITSSDGPAVRFRLRRGARFAACSARTLVRHDPAESCVTDQGAKAAAVDASGDKWWLMTYDAGYTVNTAVGQLQAALGQTALDFAVTADMSLPNPDDAATLKTLYNSTGSELVRVVGR